MALEDKTQFLELFIEVTKTITSSLEPDELFDLIVHKTPAIFKVDVAIQRALDYSEMNR